MKCAECKGACCEEFALRDTDVRVPLDAAKWLRLHATEHQRGWLTFETRCTALTPAGACAIYDDRPTTCRFYPAGGGDCLEVVRRRRTPGEYSRIRDAQDPLTIHAPLPHAGATEAHL